MSSDPLPASNKLVLLILVLVMIGLGWCFMPLTTVAAPRGILSLEFASSAARATEVIQSWTPSNQLRAAAGLGLSFLFLIVLPRALAMGCRSGAARSSSPTLARVLLAIARLQPVMTMTGAPENALLLSALFSGPSDRVMTWVVVLGSVKFAVAIAGLVGTIAGVLLGRR